MKYKLPKLIMLSLALFVVLFVYLSNRVYADEAPKQGVADVARSGGHSHLNAPVSYFEIATTSQQTVNVAIGGLCQDDNHAEAKAWINSSPSKQNYGSSNDCKTDGNCPNSNPCLTFKATTYKNNTDYSGQLYTATLTVYKIDQGFSDNGHAAFKVYADGGARVSYNGDNDRYTKWNGTNNNNVFGLWPAESGCTLSSAPCNPPNAEFRFTPTCNFDSSKQVYLKWSDADYGSGSQPTQPYGDKVYWKLVDESDSNKQIAYASNSELGGPSDSGVIKNWGVNLKKNHVYKWSWFGLNEIGSDANAIQIIIPFSENFANFGLNCSDWSLNTKSKVSPNQTVNKKAADGSDATTTITFTHTIKNTGTTTATFKWEVRGAYNPGPYGNNRCGDNGAKDTHGHHEHTIWQDGSSGHHLCPTEVTDLRKDNSATLGGGKSIEIKEYYQFPSNANDGDKYCQLVEVEPKSSDNSSADTSNPACVKYNSTPVTSASCSINSVVGDGPGGIVIAGHSMKIYASITNTGNTELTNWNYFGLWAGNSTGGVQAYDHTRTATNYTTSNTAGDYGVDTFSPRDGGSATQGYVDNPDPNYKIEPGDTVQVHPINLPAPADPANVGVATFGHPSYNGQVLGSPCGIIFKTYKPVTLTPHATATPSAGFRDEDPQKIDYHTWVDVSPGGTSAADFAYSCFYQQDAAHQPSNPTYSCPTPAIDSTAGGTYPADMLNHSGWVTPPVYIHSGSDLCAYIQVAFTQAYEGAGGANDLTQGSNPANAWQCVDIHNEPYTHIFGNDAVGGGGFGDNCTSTSGGIQSFLSTTGYNATGGSSPPAGSGVQIGALSIGPINGFSSAILRSSDPKGSSGLNIANNGVGTVNGPGAPFLGGNLGGAFCSADYFASMPAGTNPSTTNSTSANRTNGTGTVKNETEYYIPSGGTLTISGGSIDDATNVAIYVKGNVHITGNIQYTHTAWDTLEHIPTFELFVKGGSVLIDPGVSNLDGLYVSQPDSSGAGGNIYTCGSASHGYTASDDLLGTCQSQLVVNGAFVGQHVFLSRALGSLRDTASGEKINEGTVKSCADGFSTAEGDCASEIFNFSPELLLAQPATRTQSGPTTGKYDYVTSLSPVL